MNKRPCMLAAGAAALLLAQASAIGQAQEKISDGVVKIGVLTDLGGPYSDNAGAGAAYAAQLAVQDVGGRVLGARIEVVVADHQNKPDIGNAKAREWFDREKVDVITEMVSSAVAVSVMKLAQEKNRLTMVVGASSNRITNEDCTPNNVHWSHDGYSLANVGVKGIIQRGGDSWYFVTVDYTSGHSLEQEAAALVRSAGGKVLGSVRHPFPASDFAPYLLKAQNSGAKVIALANAGQDAQTAIKTAKEFGLTQKQQVVGLIFQINEVHGLGLREAQGMYVAEGFYWDRDEETRKFARRYFEKMKKMPNMLQAGMYSSVTHYLKAIQAAGTDEAKAVMAKMKSMPVNDMYAKNARVREDGRMVHDMYLMRVKTPAESKYAWDYYNIVKTISGDEAFAPLATSKCALVKK